MLLHFGFDEDAYNEFQKGMEERYDFVTKETRKKEACARGLRRVKYVQMYGQRVPLCCTPNRRHCQTIYGKYEEGSTKESRRAGRNKR